MVFLAKNYKLRSELEAVILSEAGADIDKNREAGHVIQGTEEDLRSLFLSDTTTVFGVKCVCTDNPTVKVVEEKNKKK